MDGTHRDTQRYNSRRRRKRKGAGIRLAFIALVGAVAFGVGFFALWSLGGWIIGNFSSSKADGPDSAGVMPSADYELEPLVDLLAFRDLSYVPVKGIHLTPNAASSAETLTPRIEMADTTEINAFIIDLKADQGYLAYDSQVPMAIEADTVNPIIKDIQGLVKTLHEHEIVPVARIVCFKDDVLTESRPDLGIHSSEGGLWHDSAGHAYLDPYNPLVWEYLVQVAEEAAGLGFREIQFDYVRFPTDGNIELMQFPTKFCSKDDAIAGFLAYARPRLEKALVWVSADVYGLVVRHKYSGFGQQLEKMCENIDIVCPMVYPSHYDSGSYGSDDPNAEPYRIVSGAMVDMAKRLPGTGVEGRPYLQDFEWDGVPYDGAMMQSQIKAAEEQGFNEWILWGPFRRSTVAALDPD